MLDRLANFARRIFAGPAATKFSEVWVSSTVTPGEAIGGRFAQAPGKTFVGRATQYVLICASMNARLCASQRMRLYAPARTKAEKWWKGRKIDASSRKGRKRLDRLKDRRAVGVKAADYGEYAGDIQEVIDHPALSLLRNPNPWQTGGEFLEGVYQFQELAGNAYINTYFDDAAPEMYNLAPQFVTVVPSETQFIAGYLYDRDSTSGVMFSPDDVMHFKHSPSPLSPYYGLGPLQAVLLEADLAAAATQAEVYRWLNGGRPDFVVEVPPETTSDQRAQIKAEIRRETQGVKKSGKFLILGNSKVVPLGFRPKDMEYIAGLTRSDELIWNAFGVPQSELKMNDANYASASTGNVQYLGRTIAPRCNRNAEYWTELLLPKFGVEPGSMWFAYDEIVPEDELREAEMDRLDVAAGILTLNEARANRGLEAYEPEVGDVVRINGTSIERLDAPPLPPMPFGSPPSQEAEDPEEPEDDTEDTTDDTADAIAEKVLAGLLEAKRGLHDEESPSVGVDHRMRREGTRGDGGGDGRDVLHRPGSGVDLRAGLKFYGLDHKDPILTDAPRGALAKLDGFAGRLDEWYRNAISEALKSSTAPGGVIRVSGVELEKIIEEELAKLFTFAAQDAAMQIGQSLEVAPSRAIEFLGTYKVRLAQAVTDDVSSTLTSVIRDGLEGGSTYDTIARQITADLPEFTGWRAERIARTETANALTEGRVMAWEDLGVGQKQWLLSANPCEICVAIAQTYQGPIPMGQPFFKVGDTIPGTTVTVSWRDIQGPPGHPACACGLLPVQGDQ